MAVTTVSGAYAISPVLRFRMAGRKRTKRWIPVYYGDGFMIRLEKVNGKFGIYDDNTPVGFLMIGFDVDDYWEDAPEIARGNYNLWRLMIDKEYQGKEFGREAVLLFEAKE